MPDLTPGVRSEPCTLTAAMQLSVPDAVREIAARRLGGEGPALPAYVYDTGQLAAHVARIRAALPAGVELYYAVKANPDPALLRTVAAHADGLEVSSGGELAHVARAIPGCAMAFGGPGKTAAELAAAVRLGAKVHVESIRELRLVAAAADAGSRHVDVLLRVNLPDAAHADRVAATGGRGGGAPLPRGALTMGGQPSPFGMDPETLDQCARLLPSLRRLRLRGIHAHLACGLDASALLRIATTVITFGREWCEQRGVNGAEINIGGGMAVDYARPGARFDWTAYGCGLGRLTRPGETLRIEPGRAVTAYCGWYVTSVLDVKRSHGQTFAVLQGGTHHLRTPAARGHDQPFAVIPQENWPFGWPRPGARDQQVTLVGQLCTPKDVLARGVPVKLLRAGDLVAFGLAGAYAWNISHHDFLMHPPPRVHYTRGDG